MAYTRRYRKRRTSRRRRYNRGNKKLWRAIKRINSKLDAEPKKLDIVKSLLSTDTGEGTDFSWQLLNKNVIGQRVDYASILNLTQTIYQNQGSRLDDFTGNRFKIKSIYLALHASMQAGTAYPVTVRVMVVQDTSYFGTDTTFTAGQLTTFLFGVAPNATASTNTGYASKVDYTLLPISPLQPGRFKVLRDTKISLQPSGSCDKVKKLYIKQRQLKSYGRIFYGAPASNVEGPPTSLDIEPGYCRNQIYLLMLYQNSKTSTDSGLTIPTFSMDVQSRMTYYDN